MSQSGSQLEPTASPAAPRNQPALNIPITALSYANRSNHIGKPLWNHLVCHGNSYIAFETTAQREPVNGPYGATYRAALRVFHEGRLHTEIYLNHLAHLAAIDSRNGDLGKENGAKLTIIVKKPLLAIKYTNEDYEVKRMQFKFNPAPDTGFDVVCKKLTENGLDLQNHSDAKVYKQQATQPGLTIPVSRIIQSGPAVAPRAIAPAQVPLQFAGIPGSVTSVTSDNGVSRYDGEYLSRPTQVPEPTHQYQHGQMGPMGPDPFAARGQHIHAQRFHNMQGISSLTSKPVHRKLSFSTPPSSTRALEEQSFDTDVTGLGAETCNTYPQPAALESPAPTAAHLQSHHPEAQVYIPERRPFFQKLSPLRNSMLPQVDRSDFQSATPTLPAHLATNLARSRPLSAPVHPGASALYTIIEDITERPPKRILPFPSPLKPKKIRKRETKDNVDSGDDPTPAAPKKRPATSPANLELASVYKGNAGVKARKATETKTTGKTVVAKSRVTRAKKPINQSVDNGQACEKSALSTPPSAQPQPSLSDTPTHSEVSVLPPTVETDTIDLPMEGTDNTGVIATATVKPKPKPKKSARKCAYCRKAGAKCDMIMPACQRCDNDGQVCDYTAPAPSRASTRRAQTGATVKEQAVSAGGRRTKNSSVDSGTQTALVSMNVPAPKRKLVAPNDQRAQQLATVSELMQSADAFLRRVNGKATSEMTTIETLNTTINNGPSPSEEARKTAFEAKLCDILMDDKFPSLMEDVEEIAKRTGIAI